MRIVVLVCLLVMSVWAQKIVILNSNGNVPKYKSVQEAFVKHYKGEVEIVDVATMSQKEIKEYLYDEYPEIIYAIGNKAYGYANMYVPEKTIFFSSIMNYQRLKMPSNRFGVSNELHTGMHLTLIKSLFEKTTTLSILYSQYTQDLYLEFKNNASLMNIEVIGQKVYEHYSVDDELLKDSDGLIIIADPILLKDETSVEGLFHTMKILKKPVFAYHELFVFFGASLVVSAHNPTIGQQVAMMIEAFLKNSSFTPIQVPMGTEVILNKKALEKQGIQFNEKALLVVDEVIE